MLRADLTTATWRDPVANAASLPLTDNQVGDVRLTLDTNTLYTWNGISWAGVTVLSDYAGYFRQATQPTTAQVPDGMWARWYKTAPPYRMYVIANEGGVIFGVHMTPF